MHYKSFMSITDDLNNDLENITIDENNTININCRS